jgi:hypothetical protein
MSRHSIMSKRRRQSVKGADLIDDGDEKERNAKLTDGDDNNNVVESEDIRPITGAVKKRKKSSDVYMDALQSMIQKSSSSSGSGKGKGIGKSASAADSINKDVKTVRKNSTTSAAVLPSSKAMPSISYVPMVIENDSDTASAVRKPSNSKRKLLDDEKVITQLPSKTASSTDHISSQAAHTSRSLSYPNASSVPSAASSSSGIQSASTILQKAASLATSVKVTRSPFSLDRGHSVLPSTSTQQYSGSSSNRSVHDTGSSAVSQKKEDSMDTSKLLATPFGSSQQSELPTLPSFTSSVESVVEQSTDRSTCSETVSSEPVPPDASPKMRLLQVSLFTLGVAGFTIGSGLLYSQCRSFTAARHVEFSAIDTYRRRIVTLFGAGFIIVGFIALQFVARDSSFAVFPFRSSIRTNDTTTSPSRQSSIEPAEKTESSAVSRLRQDRNKLLVYWSTVNVLSFGRNGGGVALSAIVVLAFLSSVNSRIISTVQYLNSIRSAILWALLALGIISASVYGMALYRRRKHLNNKVIDILADEVLEVMKAGDNEIGMPLDFVREEIADRISKLSRKIQAKRKLKKSRDNTAHAIPRDSEMSSPASYRLDPDGVGDEIPEIVCELDSLTDSWLNYLCTKDNIKSLWPKIVNRVLQDKRVKKFEREYYGERRTVWRRLDCRTTTPVGSSTNGSTIEGLGSVSRKLTPILASASNN